MNEMPNNPVWLAPMADITSWPVRKMFFRVGVGLAHTEMVASRALMEGHSSAFYSLQRHHDEGPLVLQLFSGDVASLLEAAQEAFRISSFEALSINMACPSKKVMASGGGASLINRPHVAAEMIRQAKNLGFPIWVKTRIPSRNLKDVASWCDLLISAGAKNVALHGRTVSQGYKGSSDRNIIGEVARAFPGKITGTGDVFTSDDVLDYLEKGCIGVLVARGALKDPFIVLDALAKLGFRNDRKATFEFQREIFRSFLSDLCQVKDNLAMHLLRRFLSCIFKGMPGASQLRSSMARAHGITQAFEIFNSFANNFSDFCAKEEAMNEHRKH